MLTTKVYHAFISSIGGGLAGTVLVSTSHNCITYLREGVSDHPAICGLCPQGCWVRVTVSNGKLVAVTPDLDPAYGNICARGRLAPQVIYSSERIMTPLIRSGRKGTKMFRQATWDEALDRIASEFKSIRDALGPTALASYMGAGMLEDGVSDFFGKVLTPFGSPNDMDCGSICYVSSRILAPVTTLGIHGDCLTPDFENADVIIIWGTNPIKDGLPDKMRRIRDARSRGAKLVVIDPRCHQLAKEADLWIPVRPGSDGALILALITLIINKKWYDSEFVLRWTAGFEELADYAALFTLKVAESICGIDAASIEQLAGIISRASGVAADFYSGLEFSACGVQSTRALFSLLALTGNIDADGGLYIHDYPHKPYDEYCIDRHNPPIGAREYPLFYALTGMAHIAGLPDAVLRNDPYPVRGLLLAGGSPYLSYPDSATWMRTYEELDFLAVIDRFMSEETAWADVILPAATYYEISSYHTYRNHIRLRDQVIEPIGQAMNDSLILSAIAQSLGYGDAFPKSEKEIRDRALRNYPELFESCHDNGGVVVLPRAERRVHKFASGHLRSDQGPGFPTPSGKFEFASTLLKCYGYDPLPVYAEPYPSDTENSLPLMLTTGARTR